MMELLWGRHRDPGPHRRDGRWAWFVLGYAYACAAMGGGLSFSYGVILPTLMLSLGANRQLTALVGSLALGFQLLLCVVASKLCERFTCRLTNGAGMLSIVVGLILSSLVQSVYPLYLTYSLLIGFGTACSYCACFISIRQYFNKHYALATGVTSAGAGTGVLCFGPVVQLLVEAFDWRNTYRILTCVFIVLLFLTIIFDPNVERPEVIEHPAISDEVTRRRDYPPPVRRSGLWGGIFDLSVWKFPEYTVAVVSIFISTFGHYTPYIHLVKYAEEQGLSSREGSLLFIFIGISTIISRIIAGRICDVTVIKSRHVNQAAASLSGVATILLTQASTFAHLVIFAVAYGLADGAFRVTMNLLFMNTSDPVHRVSAFGQANMMTSLTNVIGPVMAGLMADQMGTYVSAFYMAGATTLLGSAVFTVHLCCLKSRRSHAHDEEVVYNPMDDPAAYTGPAALDEDTNALQDETTL